MANPSDAATPADPSGPDFGAGLDPKPAPPGEMRVGDRERNSALDALGEHLTAGRINLDEYGDRSAQVAVARTADDLSSLFDDLPAPHPVLPGAGTAIALAADGSRVTLMPPGRGQPAVPGDFRSTAQKLVAAAAAASVFVAVALFFVTGLWYWFLLIPAISAIAGSIWGPDWKDPDNRAGHDRRGRIERRHPRGEIGN